MSQSSTRRPVFSGASPVQPRGWLKANIGQRRAAQVQCQTRGPLPAVRVVEDEALIAMDIAEIVSGAGFGVLGPVSTVQQALALIRDEGCAFAVLDTNLGTQTAEPVALKLRAAGIPFVVVSGYSREQQPAGMRDAPLLGKPLEARRLVAEIRRAVEAV